jgi:TPR repeat protein
MWGFLKKIIDKNGRKLDEFRATSAYDEALNFHNEKDYKKALPKMLEAAVLGHPPAMCLLGSMYLLGQGVKEDGEHAVEWLLKSIDKGYFEASSVLGMAYVTGKAGVKIQRDYGIKLLKDAAESGDTQAQQMLALISKGEGIFAKKTPKGSKLH